MEFTEIQVCLGGGTPFNNNRSNRTNSVVVHKITRCI